MGEFEEEKSIDRCRTEASEAHRREGLCVFLENTKNALVLLLSFVQNMMKRIASLSFEELKNFDMNHYERETQQLCKGYLLREMF